MGKNQAIITVLTSIILASCSSWNQIRKCPDYENLIGSYSGDEDIEHVTLTIKSDSVFYYESRVGLKKKYTHGKYEIIAGGLVLNSDTTDDSELPKIGELTFSNKEISFAQKGFIIDEKLIRKTKKK